RRVRDPDRAQRSGRVAPRALARIRDRRRRRPRALTTESERARPRPSRPDPSEVTALLVGPPPGYAPGDPPSARPSREGLQVPEIIENASRGSERTEPRPGD